MTRPSGRPRVPRCVYDTEADTAYIELTDDERRIEETTEISDGPGVNRIWLDFDFDGRLVGIEVMQASLYLPPSLLATADDSADQSEQTSEEVGGVPEGP